MSLHSSRCSKDRRRQRRALIRRDGYRCRYCGTTEGYLTQDHVIPRAAGGRSVLPNLVLACEPCNKAKGDAIPESAAA